MGGQLLSLLEFVPCFKCIFPAKEPIAESNEPTRELMVAGRISPRLNYDVLLSVMTFLVPPSRVWATLPDVLSLMLTCRALHDAGMPIYLGREILVPTDSQRLARFCDYMLSHPSRPSYLRALRIDGSVHANERVPDTLQLELNGKLIEILDRAHGLRSLSVFGAAKLLNMDERFAMVISSFKQLKQLRLRSADTNVLQMVPKIHSPVAVAYVSFWGLWDRPSPDVGSPIETRPLVCLSGFRDSLADLHLICPPRSLAHGSPDQWVQFPKLTSLKIEGIYVVPVPVLIHHFPNLRQLAISITGSYCSQPRDLKQIRESNRRLTQTENHWRQLDELNCNIPSTYALGLQCNVRHWNPVSLAPCDKAIFHDIMNDIQPSHLQLNIDSRISRTEDLEDLFPRSPVTHLVLNVYLSVRRSINRISDGELLRNIVLWTSRFQLSFLILRFHLANSADPNKKCLPELDTESYAQQLAHECLPLRYLYLARYPGLCDSILLWEISRGGSGIQLKPLSEPNFQQVTPEHFK